MFSYSKKRKLNKFYFETNCVYRSGIKNLLFKCMYVLHLLKKESNSKYGKVSNKVTPDTLIINLYIKFMTITKIKGYRIKHYTHIRICRAVNAYVHLQTDVCRRVHAII